MDGKRREFVHFSLGFGIFQNDDDFTNGWNVSAAQAPYQGQNVEVEVGGGTPHMTILRQKIFPTQIWSSKGTFWAKTGPFGAPGGPEEGRYQAKVC